MVASIVNGEPATSVSAPPALTENIETVALDELPIASSPLVGLNASESGVALSANGEPGTCVSAPSAATENIDTVLSLKLAVASSLPFELNDIAFWPLLALVLNGEPATWVSAPAALTENTDTVLSAFVVEVRSLAFASSLPFGLNATESGMPPVVNVEPGTGANAGTPGVAAAEPENTLADRPTIASTAATHTTPIRNCDRAPDAPDPPPAAPVSDHAPSTSTRAALRDPRRPGPRPTTTPTPRESGP